MDSPFVPSSAEPVGFRIKICGIRRRGDADAAAAAGADAVGLNFYPASIRHVDPEDPATAELAGHARALGLCVVGVFVDFTADRIGDIDRRIGLDMIQLHGDEPIEVARELIAGGRRVLRAIKLPTGPVGAAEIERLIAPWRAVGCAVLLDADAGSRHGGSGLKLDWPSIAAWSRIAPPGRWTLAGGLGVDNVAAAIAASTARSIDVASGVESTRGVKDAVLIGDFVAASRLTGKS